MGVWGGRGGESRGGEGRESRLWGKDMVVLGDLGVGWVGRGGVYSL